MSTTWRAMSGIRLCPMARRVPVLAQLEVMLVEEADLGGRRQAAQHAHLHRQLARRGHGCEEHRCGAVLEIGDAARPHVASVRTIGTSSAPVSVAIALS
jgi:hypothetical protein